MNNSIEQLNQQFSDKDPKEIVAYALNNYSVCGLSFSGAEDVVLIDMALKVLAPKSNLQVFSLDTGRLHVETYEFIEKVRKHYDITIELMYPNHDDVAALVRDKGLFSFYEDGHKECCGIRKIKPLKRKLSTLNAWITGQRRDQSPATRDSVAIVEDDSANSGIDNSLVKFNPLSMWSSKRVWDYIRYYDVPYNPLHDQGFISIGCAPCTRAVGPNQHEREGRWWWEEATAKECGLHNTTINKPV